MALALKGHQLIATWDDKIHEHAPPEVASMHSLGCSTIRLFAADQPAYRARAVMGLPFLGRKLRATDSWGAVVAQRQSHGVWKAVSEVFWSLQRPSGGEVRIRYTTTGDMQLIRKWGAPGCTFLCVDDIVDTLHYICGLPQWVEGERDTLVEMFNRVYHHLCARKWSEACNVLDTVPMRGCGLSVDIERVVSGVQRWLDATEENHVIGPSSVQESQ